MSWRPPPSFGEPKTKKTTSDTQKATSTALAPAFVMKDIEISTQKGEESDPAIEPPSALRNQSFIRTVQRPTKEAMKSSGIRWNHQIFLVENDDGNNSSTEADEDMRIPSREQLGFKSLQPCISTIVDKTLLQTRFEWNQLLVSKDFKHYKRMISARDSDMPAPEDLEGLEEDFLFEEDEALMRIRKEMLNDPDLTEREIGAFFEGFKLLQFKVNSLQAQIRGLKTMQRLAARSFVGTHQLQVSSVRSLRPQSQLCHGKHYRMGLPPRDKRSDTVRSTETSIAFEPRSKKLRKLPPSSKKDGIPPANRSDTTAKKQPGASRPGLSKDKPRLMSKSLRALSIKRIREDTAMEENSDVAKLLQELEDVEQRQKKLEKQLAQAGVVIAEDIPYDVAKAKVESIALRMCEIGGSDVNDPELKKEYFTLEQDMEKYTAALQLTDEWIEEQEKLDREWEESVMPANQEAIKKLRRHMPVDVRNIGEVALSTQPTLNGKYLPKNIAKKFKRTNVLQLLRTNPEAIVPMHPSFLENLRITGLTLTERRALHEHLKSCGSRWKAMQADKMTERKWMWYNMMRNNFKENVDSWQRHVNQYGPPGNHPYATRDKPNVGCPLLGKQCPLKADKLIDYDGDYGFPEGAQYFKTEVKKSNVDNVSKAKQEAHEGLQLKKSMDRSVALKKHYKGKIVQVSLANRSCEAMEESMDKIEVFHEKWIRDGLKSKEEVCDNRTKKEVTACNEALNELKLGILQFAERSGMHLTGKRDTNADQPDNRCMTELALCEELIETAEDFYKGIEKRMDEMKVKDGKMKSTISQLMQLLEELHERNLKTIKSLGESRPERSRKLKTRETIAAEVKKDIATVGKKGENLASNRPSAGMPGLAGRSGLMDTVAGRGHGQGGMLSEIVGFRRGQGGGRDDLMSAIAGRGRGGKGNAGLLAAIAAR